MRARAVHYMLKVDRWDDAQSALRSVLEETSRLNGFESFTSIANPETGRGTSLTVFSSSEALEAAAPAMQKILSGFDAYMQLTPTVEVGDVVAELKGDG